MSKNLVIVESPAKARTIGQYLGKDFTVEASFGHVRDLPKSGMGIDIEHNFEPSYEVSPDKKKRIAELKKLVKTADTVWLASDEDREGEAIAWHLCQALSLPVDKTKRIVFHEITKEAIERAMANPRTVDGHLVDAQQARRVLDRLVGYELSPVLWKKVQRGLSAGRVQSVAVRLIVEREREIENFAAGSAFKVTAEFNLDGGVVLKAELPTRFKTEPEAQKFLDDCVKASFKVASLETKPAKRTPAAPFTTSTLQQEASRKLGFSVRQTMSLAQRLYEAGHITYMRTDSVHLSELALQMAATAITKLHGANYHQQRQYTTKSAGAQEAHEAIRPTRFDRDSVGGERNEQRLYELIWKRAIASQMAEASLERTTASVAISTRPEVLQAKGEVVVFDGFLKVYLEGRDEEEGENDLLPALTEGQNLDLAVMTAAETFDRPKPRYTEASLVKQLEELGIGRPSTYAPTISTIQDRGYVEKGDLEAKQRQVRRLQLAAGKVSAETITENYGADRSKLFPTDIGILVTDFLVNYFPEVVDVHFTARVEDEFDGIADGQKPWQQVIEDFYQPFHSTVEAAESISRQEASGARELGTDPKSGKPVIARLGRFGPMLQLGSAEDEEKPKFAPLPEGRKLQDVTLEEALELFKLPRVIGKAADGQEISANFGRFGPYIKWGSLYASIKPDDPFSITLKRARELITEKEAADANRYIQRFEGSTIAVLNGRFGPYITDGKKNAKIPKDKDAAKLTLAECKELLAAAPDRKSRRRFTKR